MIPCLNEKKKIGKVLNNIQKLKINNFDLILDVIIVDGGSSDGSVNIIKKYKEFKFYKLNNALVKQLNMELTKVKEISFYFSRLMTNIR